MRVPYYDLSSDSEDDDDPILHTSVCVIGAPKVGKTSFIKRLVHNEFSLFYSPTNTIEITTKRIGRRHYTFYDISSYNNPLPKYRYITADVIIFMYNMKRDQTIHQLPDMFDKIIEHINPNSQFEAFFINQQFSRCLEDEKTDSRTFNINNCSNEGFQRLMFAIEQVLTV